MRPLTMVLPWWLALAGPWYVMVGLRTDGAWLADFYAKYNIRPLTQPFLGHSGPFWYYVPAILIGFFPWSVFLGPGLMETMAADTRIGTQWTVGYHFRGLLAGCVFGLLVRL